jgi:AsmA protein
MQEIQATRAQIEAVTDPLDHTAGHAAGDAIEPPRRGPFAPRFLFLYFVLLVLVLLAVLPPLVNVSRFKHRIVTSISASLGRPVHLDSVSLVLLPFPGFKLENFVVAEDPAFGAEPVIHANEVEATLRFSSLWRRKVEFSKISLQEPSINLVRAAAGTPNQGRWNIESILLQAARIPVAPTAQANAGTDPRFPYVEATDARVNIKSGVEKLPFSFTEADFALWLPQPNQWRIRMVGKPSRTDTSAQDTGTVSLEGTLGRAERFDLIPLDLAGEWRNAPLGEATRVLTGRDAGLRGDLRLNVALHGTVGKSMVKASLELRNARRAEFVPPRSLDLRFDCQAAATETFHAFLGIRCGWPTPAAPMLALTADIPDVHNPGSASFEVGTPGLPASFLLDWLRVASPRVDPEVTATGTLAGKLARDPAATVISGEEYTGQFSLKGATLQGGPIGDDPIVLGDVTIASDAPATDAAASPRKGHSRRKANPAPATTGGFVMAPATLALGGKDPATLEGRFDQNGYSLHLSGNVLRSRLLALATSIPQFGDGLADALPAPPPPSVAPAASPAKAQPIHIDLTSTHLWDGVQSWSKTATKTPAKSPTKHR